MWVTARCGDALGLATHDPCVLDGVRPLPLLRPSLATLEGIVDLLNPDCSCVTLVLAPVAHPPLRALACGRGCCPRPPRCLWAAVVILRLPRHKYGGAPREAELRYGLGDDGLASFLPCGQVGLDWRGALWASKRLQGAWRRQRACARSVTLSFKGSSGGGAGGDGALGAALSRRRRRSHRRRLTTSLPPVETACRHRR